MKKKTLKKVFDITALTFDQLLMFLEKADESKKVDSDVLRRIVDSGNVTNPDGTISFVKFVAYMASQIK